MNEIRAKQVQRDAEAIDKVMRKYSGASGAHFGFIAYATGERQFLAGGNAAVTGICIAEAIAMLIKQTPGMTADIIDSIADTAKAILGETETGGRPQ